MQTSLEAGVEREEAQGKRLGTLAREAGVEHYEGPLRSPGGDEEKADGKGASLERETGVEPATALI